MTQSWTQVSATGHRPQSLPEGSQEWLADEFARLMGKLGDQCGMQVAISGAAMGADLLWAETAVAAGMRLWLYRPFAGHDSRWREQQWRDRLAAVAVAAERDITISDQPGKSAFFQRNLAMLDDSDAVVAAQRPGVTSGGTIHALRHAWQRRLPVVRCDVVEQHTSLPGPGSSPY